MMRASIAAGRLGRPDEFGDACAFLCSAQAGYISGQNLSVFQVSGNRDRGSFVSGIHDGHSRDRAGLVREAREIEARLRERPG